MKKITIIISIILLSVFTFAIIKESKVIYVDKLYIGESDSWIIKVEVDGSYIYVDKKQILTSTRETRTQVKLISKYPEIDVNAVDISYLNNGRGISNTDYLMPEDLVFKDDKATPGIKFFESKMIW